jgi:predicted O-methyltransferase YrrM
MGDKFVFNAEDYGRTWNKLLSTDRYKKLRSEHPGLENWKDVNWKEADIQSFQEITARRGNEVGGIHGSEMLLILQACLVEKPKLILEIGVRNGLSTRFFAAVAERLDGQVISIEGDLKPEVMENLKLLNLSHRVSIINKWSPWIGIIPNWEIDLLLIDGDHEFVSVLMDYHFFNYYVNEGGLIVFHDCDMKDVQRAIAEVEHRDKLEKVLWVPRIAMFRKTLPRKKVYFQTAEGRPGPGRDVVDEPKKEVIVSVEEAKVKIKLSPNHSDLKGKLRKIFKTDSIVFIEEEMPLLENTAFFGPWLGEFGFEIMWWQGFCRKKSRDFQTAIVSTFENDFGLYRDFADEMIHHNLKGERMCGFLNKPEGEFTIPNAEAVFIPAEKGFIKPEDQEYYQYGSESPRVDCDIIFHATEHRRKTYEHWDKLVESFSDFKLGCFGLKEGKKPDHYVEGTEDLRGLELSELSRYLNGARVIIGPVSGAMHFASYSGANIVVWTDDKIFTFRQTIRQRFEELANPFDSPVRVLDEWDWNPPVEKIIQGTLSILLG